MKNYLLSVSFLVLAFWSFSGCAPAVRYSPDEIRDYPPAVQENIRQGNVMTGMTPRQVRYAWGAPSTINILSPTEEGKQKEEWIYSAGVFVQKRILFIDGKVVDIYPEPKRVGETKQDDGKQTEKQ